MSDPPATERRDGAYEYHGETVEDPYRWLEDGDDPDVRAWVDAQDEHAADHLETLPARDHLRPRVEELARTREVHPVTPTPSGYFWRVRDPDQDHPVLYHGEDPGGDGRVLVDPNEMGDETTAVNWYAPSHDGELVAYGVDEDGAEQYDVHVMDVASGEDVDVVPDAGRTRPDMLAWMDDGFYYVRTGSVGGEGQLDKELRYHELGADVADEPVVHDEFGPETWPVLEASPDGDHVVVAFSEGWERTDLYRLRHGDEALEPVLEGFDAVFEPLLRGSDCFLRTSFGAPNYRLARLDVADPPAVDGPADLETVVPDEDDAILRSFTATRDRLLVHRSRDVVAEVAVHDRDGSHRRDIDLPGPGSVAELRGSPVADEAFFTYQSFDHPESVLRYADGDGVETVAAPEVTLEADLVVDQEWCESADGTEVPLFVVRREGVDPDGTNPAVLYGYGGFEISLSPMFRKYAVPFLEDGGVFAVANCRGGGEFGEAWHHAARHGDKQHTFDDFHAAAEHLVDRGWAARDRLACMGGSNGGLTVGAAITQRPDLFAAAVCAVPLLDMLRFHRSLLGRSWTSEYGNAEADSDAFEYIRAYSPYHSVAERAYPATLLVTAERDTRVDPFHARKMAARLQASQTGDAPVLLRTYGRTGHGVGKPVSKVVAEQVDRWAFCYEHLGVLD